MHKAVTLRGCVHGRFQPPHLEHLEYIQEALKRTEFLTIGITQPNSVRLDECNADPHRAWPSENPMTYDERCDCIQAMLAAQGVDQDRYEFIPFPIDRPVDLLAALDSDVVCFTTIRDHWNLKKISILESLGFSVEVLWDKLNVKGISGTEIRQRIRFGDDTWRSDVHPAVVDRLEALGVVARIRAGA